MKSKRSAWLLSSLLCLALSGPAMAAPAGKPADRKPDPRWEQRKVLHLLERIGFGPTPAEVASASATGIDSA